MVRKQKPTASNFLRYLQGWIGVVGLMAFGNTVSCFIGHNFLSERLYTSSPEMVNGLTARLFGCWTLLAAILRLYCCVHIRNKQVYNLTFISYFVVLIHFITEIVYYKTCSISAPGVIAPLSVAGISVVWMGVGYYYIDGSGKSSERESEKKLQMEDVLLKHKKDT